MPTTEYPPIRQVRPANPVHPLMRSERVLTSFLGHIGQIPKDLSFLFLREIFEQRKDFLGCFLPREIRSRVGQTLVRFDMA
jgi:predicted phosphohydrolase